MDMNFYEEPFNPADILRTPEHYIRFHNQKATRLLKAREQFEDILKTLRSDLNPEEKRLWLAGNLKGLGMKESSHFLRNIGYSGLAILDRHILKHLAICGVFGEIPKPVNIKSYLNIESAYKDFALWAQIPLDELDLLFWSYETGEILK
jgi:N-glycosylase/DNA lyase